MKILIIRDETVACEKLVDILSETCPDIQIADTTESIYVSKNKAAEFKAWMIRENI